MTNESRKVSGYLLVSVPTIIYGGYFLLKVLSKQHEDLQLSDFQKAMFRAGHAHAGVLLILALVVQLFIDHITVSNPWRLLIRLSFPVSTVLISLGFFAAAAGTQITKPTEFIFILYVGIALFILGLFVLGITLIRQK